MQKLPKTQQTLLMNVFIMSDYYDWYYHENIFSVFLYCDGPHVIFANLTFRKRILYFSVLKQRDFSCRLWPVGVFCEKSGCINVPHSPLLYFSPSLSFFHSLPVLPPPFFFPNPGEPLCLALIHVFWKGWTLWDAARASSPAPIRQAGT